MEPDSGSISAYAAPLTGPGQVQALEAGGAVLNSFPFDPSVAPVSSGPVLFSSANDRDGSSAGESLRCPSGKPDVVANQATGATGSTTIRLYNHGAAGEPALCLGASTSAPALVPFHNAGGPAVLTISAVPGLTLWGAVQPNVARVELTIGTKHAVFVNERLTTKTGIPMSSVGRYQIFAMPVSSSSGTIDITTYDKAGQVSSSNQFG